MTLSKNNFDQAFLFGKIKNCFEQWPKRWEYCKELLGDYFGKY
jgi:hypothetical protein